MTRLLLPLSEMPGVIRESVRSVLAAHEFVVARVVHVDLGALGIECHLEQLTERELAQLLDEIGRNASQALYSIDQSNETDLGIGAATEVP